MGESALRLVYRLVDRLVEASPAPLLGIGIGTPGLIDPVRGVVRKAVNLGWQDLPLRQLLQDRYQKPIYLMNDSQAAALAESTFGGPRPSPHLLLIKVGRGIGAGIILNGELFHGDGFGAGEIGQVIVGQEASAGSLESVAGTQAMVGRARALLGTDLLWDAFVERVQRGDRALQAIVREAGGQLGVALAHLVAAFNIETVVITGRVVQLGEIFLRSAEESARRHVLPALIERTQLSYSALGPDIVLLGCSSSILKHELRIV
jgi:predicted NBD/HSP70 family sugar kinase